MLERYRSSPLRKPVAGAMNRLVVELAPLAVVTVAEGVWTVALEPGCFRFFELLPALGLAENVEVPGIPSLPEGVFPLTICCVFRELAFAGLSLAEAGELVRLLAAEDEDFFDVFGLARMDRSSSASISLLSSA